MYLTFREIIKVARPFKSRKLGQYDCLSITREKEHIVFRWAESVDRVVWMHLLAVLVGCVEVQPEAQE